MQKLLIFFVLNFIAVVGLSQWTEIANLGFPLKDVIFDSDTTAYLVGDNGIYYTENSAIDWEEISLFDTVEDEMIYENSNFMSIYKQDDIWYAAGQDASTTRAVIFKMSLDDLIWEMVYEGEVGSKLNGISGGSLDIKTAAGDNGLVLRSLDVEGEIWEPIETGFSNNWKSIHGNYRIGGEGGIIKSVGPDWGWELLNDNDVKDFFYKDGEDYAVSDNIVYTGLELNIPHTKFIGPLNANCITFRTTDDSWTYIGTENGVYISGESHPFEWGRCPSTFGYNVNQIYSTGLAINKTFAVCEGGAILRRAFDSGFLPYTAFEMESGGCKDSLFTFAVTSAPTGDYNWYLDDVWVGDDAEELTIPILGPPGINEMTLTRNNCCGTESVTIEFYVADLPDLTEEISFLDTIICKEGESDVLISVSSSEYRYRLYDATTEILLDEAIGLDGDLFLNTGLLTDSSFYVVSSTSASAECAAFFPDTFQIIVENPIANFKPLPINADLNQPIFFHNLSTNGSLYAWKFFNADADFENALMENPTNNYSASGLKSVRLITSTENECSDTMNVTNVNIYNADESDEVCWSIHIGDEALGDNGGGLGGGVAIDNDDEIYVFGAGLYHHMPTKEGLTESHELSKGYLGKYSTYGVLKWSANIYNSFAAHIRDVEVDENKNTIISAGVYERVTFTSSNGDVLDIPSYHEFSGGESSNDFREFFIKLDSLGEIQWYALYAEPMVTSAGSAKFCIDDDLNMYSAFYYRLPAEYGFGTIVNGNGTITYFDPGIYRKGLVITKWSPDGNVLWHTTIHADVPDFGVSLQDIACAPDGTIYFTGNFENDLTMRTPSGVLVEIPTVSSESQSLLLSLDTDGELLWKNIIHADLADTDEDISMGSAQLKYSHASEGLYLTFNGTYDAAVTFESTDIDDESAYSWPGSLIARYSRLGNYEWMNTTNKLSNYFYSLGTDDEGNVFTNGVMNGTSFSGDYLIFSSTDDNDIQVDWRYRAFFMNKYNADGVLLNTFFESKSDTSHESVLHGFPRDIEIDSENNIYAYYAAVGNDIGTFPIANDTTLLISANIIAKYDQLGCIGPFLDMPKENLDLDGLTIYPNPTISILNIITPSEHLNEELSLFDFTGRLIRVIQLSDEHLIIDVDDLDAGVYFLKIKSKPTLKSCKVIID